ncbi:hypothetical protein VE03_02012 [Pseudogymnoascus sp. 23342-1-I1]|nr:hypothetical protein VE03_02012 [Pseudogymnoascus sp. 23342-1-I1]
MAIIASYPGGQPPSPTSHTGADELTGNFPSPQWEWNHNPSSTAFSLSNGSALSAATVTDDLYHARYTHTHRTLGPTSSGTIVLHFTNLADGDRAGLEVLRDSRSWIGVRKDSSSLTVSMQSGLTMTSTWQASSTGSEVASKTISGSRVWLRICTDINVGSGKEASFYYSTDGLGFEKLGSLVLGSEWVGVFMGYRYAIFNFATKALGGSGKTESFNVDAPGLTTSG